MSSQKKSFTLTELLIIVIILAGLLAMAMPELTNVAEKYRAEEAKQTLMILLGAQNRAAGNLDTGTIR